MSTTLEKRVEQLEQRVGKSDDFLLMIIAPMGVDPDKIGPERAIVRTPIGYASVGGKERRWAPGPNETIEELKCRMQQELKAEGVKAFAVIELYKEN